MAYHLVVNSRDQHDRHQTILIKSAAIVAGFALANQPVPAYLNSFLQNGVTYSYQDFDVLSAALRELRTFGVSERDLVSEVL